MKAPALTPYRGGTTSSIRHPSQDTRPWVARRTGLRSIAIVGLCKSLRVEAARNRVKVSALYPGVVQMPLLVGDKFGKVFDAVDPDRMQQMWKWMRPMALVLGADRSKPF
jgi:hypothetical protein